MIKSLGLRANTNKSFPSSYKPPHPSQEATIMLSAPTVKNLPANAGDPGSIPRSGRSPGEGNCNPLQYSCLRIPWTEEPGGLQSMGSQGRHNLATKHTGLTWGQQKGLGFHQRGVRATPRISPVPRPRPSFDQERVIWFVHSPHYPLGLG